jgi:putative ATPase
VERGVVTLIGATTENPFFAVNSPLISRSQVFRFESLTAEQIVTVLQRALSDRDKGFGAMQVRIDDDALAHLATTADGDARRALTALEIAVLSQSKQASRGEAIHITLEVAEESIQRKALRYDRDGDAHYDHASALIKSMRGSDPDATVYWLARMLESGEDLRFVARRIAICAAEDVGNADPIALVLANAAVQIVEFVGMPEAQLPLAQAAIYIALSPKSNASAMAIWTAMEDVKTQQTLPVPMYLRDTHYQAASTRLGHGEGYKYAHDEPDGIADQSYLGVEKKYYEPTNRGVEKRLGEYLAKVRAIRSRSEP